MDVNLAKYDNSSYHTGRNFIVRLLWYYTNILFVNNGFFPFSGFYKFLLRLFGAKIGKGVVIKPSVNIKYPWRLKIGDYSWIGENVWIDNLDDVEIGNNVVLSQGAMLLCGNHNYKKSTFDLITGKIVLEDGVWIGAKTVVTAGVTCYKNSILTVNSVASKDLEENGIYRGSPAEKISERKIEN